MKIGRKRLLAIGLLLATAGFGLFANASSGTTQNRALASDGTFDGKASKNIGTLPDATLAPEGKAVGSEQLIPIVIYHTNDIHGQIGPSPENKKFNLSPSGGAASLMTALKREGGSYLYFDSGDWFQGTPVGNMTRGEAVVDVMNALGMSAAVLGNHEFDYGQGVIFDLLNKAKFPVLASNIAASQSNTIASVSSSFLMMKQKGVNIGLFGLLPANMDTLAFPEHRQGLSFTDPIQTAARSVSILKGAGADVIIALTHLGIESYDGKTYTMPVGDIAVAKGAAGIDAILGGHTHTRMNTPVIVTSPSGKGTLITQTGGQLREVFRIVLYYNPVTRQVDKHEAKPIYLDPSAYPPDPQIASIIASYESKVAGVMSQPVGSSVVEMPRNPYGESVLHNFVADILKEHGKTDLAVVNAFGLRKDLPQGPLQYGDVYQVLSFDNSFAIAKIKGAELKKAVKNNVPFAGQTVAKLHYAKGVEIRYDPTTQKGLGLVELRVNGQAVEDDRVYTIAGDNYTLTVGGYFQGIKMEDVQIFPKMTRDIALEYVKANSPVSARIDGRLHVVLPAPLP